MDDARAIDNGLLQHISPLEGVLHQQTVGRMSDKRGALSQTPPSRAAWVGTEMPAPGLY